MTIWGLSLLLITIIFFCSMVLSGLRAEITAPIWLAILWIASCSGYTIGFGIRLIKEVFF